MSDLKDGYVSFGAPENQKITKKKGFFKSFFHKFIDYESKQQNCSKDSTKDEFRSDVDWSDSNKPVANRLNPAQSAMISKTSNANIIKLSDRRYWMLDENCRNCFECGSHFTAIRRKHHCRVCGRIFCNQCSNHFIEGSEIGLIGPQRACGYCAQILGSTNKLKTNMKSYCRLDQQQSSSTSVVRTLDCSSSKMLIHSHLVKRKPSLAKSGCSNEALDESTYNYSDVMSTVGSTRSGTLHNTIRMRQSWGPNEFQKFGRLPLKTLDKNMLASLGTEHATDYDDDVGGDDDDRTKHNSTFSDVHPIAYGVFGSILGSRFYSMEQLNYEKRVTNRDSLSQHTLEFWSRIWSVKTQTTFEFGESRADAHRIDDELVPYSSGQTSIKPLQMVKIRRNDRDIYCVSGLVLVYWLVSNMPELKRSRLKSRLLCQRFMDLHLLLDFCDPTCEEFRDNFTIYELKALNDDWSMKNSKSNSLTTNLTKSASNLSIVTLGGRISPQSTMSCWSGTHWIKSTNSFEDSGWLFDVKDSLGQSNQGPNDEVQKELNRTTFDFIGDKSSLHYYSKQFLSNFEFGLDANTLRDSTLSLSALDVTNANDKVHGSISNHGIDRLGGIDMSKPVDRVPRPNGIWEDRYYWIKSLYDDHIQKIVSQDIRDHALNPSWTPILIRLAWQVCEVVKFDLKATGMRYFELNLPANAEIDGAGQDAKSKFNHQLSKLKSYSTMDVRHYVHVKKLLNWDNKKSDLFTGTIFTKRMIHKQMPNVILHPRILILNSSISYQRTNSKMAWFESQILQEEEYITNCISKILCLQPNLIFVGGNVAYLASNFLLKSGITLFCNVKSSVLHRIARITGAQVLDSIDRLANTKAELNNQKSSTRLGICRRFEMKHIKLTDGSSKFLTFIENNPIDCKSPALWNQDSSLSHTIPRRHITHEATVCLHDPDQAVLVRAKRTFYLVLNLCHNALLELNYVWLHTAASVMLDQGPTKTNGSIKSLELQDGHVSNGLTESNVPNSNSVEDSSACASNSSSLASYLHNRLFFISPFVHMKTPYLASDEGQKAYLYAYYTYVIDWPFGRKLNDLMKQKLKIVQSEMYAASKSKQSALTSTFTAQTSQVSTLNKLHPFLTEHLELIPPIYSLKFDSIGACFPNLTSNDFLLNQTLTAKDEALYVDFKSRAFVLDSSVGAKNYQKMSTLWTRLGSLLSGNWDILFDSVAANKKCKERQQINNKPLAGSPNTGRKGESVVQVENMKRLVRSILDPRSYGLFSFLTLLYTPDSFMWPEPCVPPAIASVEFYGSNDLPLGLFLEKFCFLSQPCRNPHCNISMLDHVQRFIQTSGLVHLQITKLTQDLMPISNVGMNGHGFMHNQIQMWLYCPLCNVKFNHIYMNAQIWHLSFVKFIDLLINAEPNAVMTWNEHLVQNSQQQCVHSMFKMMHHCFAFERRVAVFKCQPVNVYEVVMPPNEIHTQPVQLEPGLQFDNRPTVIDQDACGSGEEPNSKTNTFSNRTAYIKLPNYLHCDAKEIYNKYCSVDTVFHAYIANLRKETNSPELVAMLEAFLQILHSDPTRPFMDERADLLRFLTRYLTKEDKHGHLHYSTHGDLAVVTPTSHHCVSTADASVFERPKFTMSPSPSVYEFCSEPLYAQSDEGNSSPTRLSLTCGQYSNEQINRNHGWTLLVENIEHVELFDIVQRLINELKRWIYLFVSGWNSKFADYEAVVKRTEKNIRDSKKRNTDSKASNPIGAKNVPSTKPPTANSNQSSSIAVSHASKVPNDKHPGVYANQNASLNVNLVEYDLNPIKCPRERSNSSCTNSTLYKANCCVGEDPGDRPIGDSVQSRLSLECLPSSPKLCVHLVKNDGSFHDVKAASECSELLRKNETFDSEFVQSGCITECQIPLSVMDPASISVACNSRLPESGTGLSSIHTSNPVQSLSTSSSLSLAAPSGMRRLIHNLLPTVIDLKVFDEPLGPSEHPQLGLTSGHDFELNNNNNSSNSSIGILKRFRQNQVKQREHIAVKTGSKRGTTSPNVHFFNSITPDVFVNDHELTSIIAYALTLPEYERSLFDLCSTGQNFNQVHWNVQLGQPVTAFCTTSTAADTKQLGDSMTSKSQVHLGDNLTTDCPKLITGSSPSMFRSAQTSHQSASANTTEKLGTTRSRHIKIHERFVVKELSSIEMKTFHEISNEYFDYLISAALDQRLCVLSRILGIYHVEFKNSVSGEANRLDVLVMENLFHGRTKLAYIYDLKGSLRKRLADVQPTLHNASGSTTPLMTGESKSADQRRRDPDSSIVMELNDTLQNYSDVIDWEMGMHVIEQQSYVPPVLLDQNLLNSIIDDPLYLRVHSKNALTHCLQVDTVFLANLFIMDYSLLVGVDTTTNQLVVGLIDYLRKFTLDKRLEMLIKQTITSAQGPMPTILTPDLYRERFLYQLHSYFPLVPDQWYDSLAEHTEAWCLSAKQSKIFSN